MGDYHWLDFIIMGCTERMVIFDLRFRLEVGDDELVIMWEDVIGRCLQWDGVTRAVAPVRQEDEGRSGPSSLPREQDLAPKEEDKMQSHFRSTIGNLDNDVEHRAVKRVVD